ncbi:tRNA (N(6)-L-threonylcarbamoyladenosine(37)-C(2))-methylthiotransferase MtaB [Marispirochaeta aestuarii]|uniref:tRNA (N(6)-L-threonylcarbamoyladenosine(37)-C(2))- methylthiotransferase MtaB n=1 Tax=Marispirochaeta aestuarii TaxID=1963862 RepID=UPI002ABD87AA|nr:tRNA (N(6)-L-threonylcarbamoyladenosine(37)-C(2))-methylthiotransferase MtaB [Marispirochaeta aestuarii]
MRVAFYTLGCKLNQCESEALASSFGSQGFFLVSPSEPADLYVVNTCTVTSKSEQKARRMIRKYSRENPESLVIVTGCYAQMDPEVFQSLGSRVIVVSGDQKDRLLRLPVYLNESGCAAAAGMDEVRRALGMVGEGETDRFSFDAPSFSSHSRAYLKIQDGCDNRCSYCRVTLARGDSVSLALDEVLHRAVRLEEAGFDEIILTGINLSQYASGVQNLSGLVGELLSATRRTRFRLSSLEPDYLIPENTDVFADPRVCPHFHIPVQSGDDGILRRMARRYDSVRVREAFDLLRGLKADPFIAADIIVGFPGETDAAFQSTRKLLEELRPAALHVFPFSARPGTAAAAFAEHVPERITGIRTAELRTISETLHAEYLQRWNGRSEEVLVEVSPTDTREGRGITGNYLRVRIPGGQGTAYRKGSRYPAFLEFRGSDLTAVPEISS